MHQFTTEDSDTERMYFMTPSLTPHISESNKSDYFDLESSFSIKEYQTRMLITTRNLQEVADLCTRLNINESDAQDQQPTEATDDGADGSNTQTITISTIDTSLHPKTPQERDDDSFTVVEASNPFIESFSAVMSDTKAMTKEEPFQRPVLNYSRSLCIPYTDEQEDKQIINENFMATSDTSLEFTGIVKKDKNDIGHILISYNHSTRSICTKMAKNLKERNYNVWIDQENISGDILISMASAVENCYVILMAINEPYYQSRYCRLEAEYSIERNKASIPMLMQAGYKPFGWLGIINGSKLQIDFSSLAFDEAFNLLVREIEAVRISLGADENIVNISTSIYNQPTTTIGNSSFRSENVQDWTDDDVIEWLNREKLDIFAESVKNFTGKTIWQLYKVKIHSPTDFYRMIESLLSPTVPLRLLHNLTFDAALESLFSSPMQTIHR